MTVQPHSVRFHAPGEIDDLREIHMTSDYRDATEPNYPCTDMDEAQNIVLHHVAEYVENDTEDEKLRCAALHCDLGFAFNRIAFRELVDTYRNPCPPAYAEKWCHELAEWLRAHGIGDRATHEYFTRDEGISVEALAEALGHELPEG